MGKTDVNVMSGTKVPALRFRGFSDEWVEKQLGEVLTERNVQHEPTDEYPLVSFTVENGVTPKTDRYNREFLVRTSDKKYKATEINDIVYNPANLKFGAISLNTYGKAVFSPIYVTFTVNAGIDPYYMGLFVTRDDFINYSLKYQEGTVYERMSVKSGDFLSLDISIPELPEQQAIGQFSKTIDALIQSEQDKLEQLQSLKKSFLQKMFPKKGATVPELRFDGFSGDWVEKKLGDVLTERNIKHEPNDEYPLVSFTVEKGVTPKTDRYNREFLVRTSDKKYKATEYNDIVYNPANLKFGAIALNTYGKAVFSPIYVTFTVDDGYDPYYMGLYVTTTDFINYALKYQEGTVYERMAVKSNDFLTLDVELPSIEEQFAIGQFFKIFDELIAKQEEKVENGKSLKKALLQKMFV